MPAVLDAFWNRHKKFKKNQKNIKPSRCVLLCDLVSRKNNKLGILQTVWKSVHKNSYLIRSFISFQARWISFGHNHGIVYSNDPVLCTCVHLGMVNKVALGSFNFLRTKNSFFIFLMLKMGFLWSTYQKNVPKIDHHNFKWYYTIFYAQLTICLHVKCSIDTPQEIHKYLLI
jgi:hypothetical protein